jgi:hypothetical protein
VEDRSGWPRPTVRGVGVFYRKGVINMAKTYTLGDAKAELAGFTRELEKPAREIEWIKKRRQERAEELGYPELARDKLPYTPPTLAGPYRIPALDDASAYPYAVPPVLTPEKRATAEVIVCASDGKVLTPYMFREAAVRAGDSAHVEFVPMRNYTPRIILFLPTSVDVDIESIMVGCDPIWACWGQAWGGRGPMIPSTLLRMGTWDGASAETIRSALTLNRCEAMPAVPVHMQCVAKDTGYIRAICWGRERP